jgi:NADPH:quinone reductase-like Zn-dependent oxidoreductase
MKAMRVRAPGGLENVYLDQALPVAPGLGEIQVRVRATSLNYHDYLVVTGLLPAPDGRIPMSDGAGEVLSVGEGVERFKVGDRVLSTFFTSWKNGEEGRETMGLVPGDSTDGYACEIVTMPAEAFTVQPAGYSHAEAATLTCAGLTAWRALFSDGPLFPGQTVVVQGTGGVSIFALQFAKMAGAVVYATSSSEAKLERLKTLGADHVLNYRETPEWGAKVMEMTGGRGVDHVIEVGGPNTLEQSMTACRAGAHLAIIGVLAGFDGTLPIRMLQNRRLRVEGVTVGNRRQQEDMIRAIDANGMRPVIDDRRFALEELADAFRFQESHGHFGKICVDL